MIVHPNHRSVAILFLEPHYNFLWNTNFKFSFFTKGTIQYLTVAIEDKTILTIGILPMSKHRNSLFVKLPVQFLIIRYFVELLFIFFRVNIRFVNRIISDS